MTREEARLYLYDDLAEWERDCKSKHPMKEALSLAIEALLQQPKIIRCKECKYYDKDSIIMSGIFFCRKISTEMDFDDYCSYAERKEENE